MKLLILFILTLTTLLSGCANYAGLHTCSKPIHACTDNQSCYWIRCHWWEMFHDDQLNELIDIGLCDSPTIKIAQARLRLAQSITKEANAGLWPTITARGLADRERFTQNWLIPPGAAGRTLYQGYAGLKFDYDFDFWGMHREAFNAALSKTQSACFEIHSTRLILATAIATTYFQLQNNLLQLTIAKTLLKKRQTILSILQKRAEAGIEPAMPINMASNNVEAAKITLADLQEKTELARHQLNALLGKCPGDLTINRELLKYRPEKFAIPTVIPTNLIARRPDIMALRWQIESATHSISSAKGAFYPNVNLFALAGFLSIGLENLFKASSKEASLGPAISLPIFDAGRLRANLQEKYADYDLMVEEYNQAIVNALCETANQLSALKMASQQQKAQNTSLKIKQQNYALIYNQYQNGISDYLSTLQTEEMVLEQRIIQTETQTHYLQTIIATIKALGGGYQKEYYGSRGCSKI